MKKIVLLVSIMIIGLSTYCIAGTYTITTSDSDETALQWVIDKNNVGLKSLDNNPNIKTPIIIPIDKQTFINNIIKREINRINANMNDENTKTLQEKFNKANPTVRKQIQDLLK